MPKYNKVTKITSKGYEVKTYENGIVHRLLNGKCPNTDGHKRLYLNGVKEKVLHLKTCPLEELPLYMNTRYKFIAKERLNGTVY